MNCPVCGGEVVLPRWNQRFCSYGCCARFNSLVRTKELFRLSPDDRLLRRRLLD